MPLIFGLFLFVIGLAVYRFCSQYLMHYLLLWFCFGPIICNIFYTLEQEEYYNILSWAIYLGYAIVVLDYLRFGISEKWQGLMALCVVGLIIYYVSLSFVRGTSIIDCAKYITGNVGFLLPLLFLLYKDCDLQSLGKLVRIIIYFELGLALLQPFTDLLNFHAALNGDDVMTSMVNGTFVRNNIFVELLVPLVIFIIGYNYNENKKITPDSIIIALISLFVVYNSGVRTALAAIFPLLLYAFYYFLGNYFKSKRGRIIAMFLGCVCLYSVYSIIQNIAEETGVTYTKNATDSSERQAVMFSLLNDADFAEEQTTLGLSFVVLYTFPDNPVIGPGYLLQGNGYGDFINKGEGNVTDATLAIFLCETGLIGFAVLLFVFYILLNKVALPHPLPKLVFLYLFIITISDPGVFFMGNMLVLFMLIKFYNSILQTEISE